MKVYALVGKSGTGKSFQAINLCKEKGIESIVDDGLFIHKGKAIAGKSAKKEKTKIGAVRRAIFNDENHRIDVLKKMQEKQPNSILLIGTSEKMVEQICIKLSLGKIDEKIYIEDITSEAQRKIAYRQRNSMGQHVIPVPAMEIRKDFSGYILSPIRMLKDFGLNKGGFGEKSVVRPTYSYMGKFVIANRVIGDIVRCTAKEIEGIYKVGRISSDYEIENLKIDVEISVKKGFKMIEVARQLQEKSFKMIEEMTAFQIDRLSLEIKKI